ncbi:MAG TPA: phosphatase PAP2 family protein [Chitinophagaceae bacterium]|nr:phosphatase PAP2 family protein [Chitinophagaceae bacterium]
MKLITLCAIFCWLSVNAYSQVDTTKKPIDTIPKDSGSVTLTDTLTLHAMDSATVQKVNLTPEPMPVERTRHDVYRIRPGIDWPLALAGTAFSLYGFSQIYNKDKVPEATILNLRKSDINGFDRWAADVYSPSAAKISDAPFYIAQPLPLLLLLDKDIRKDAGKFIFLYWETMAVTGVFYTGTPMLFDRYRPYAYNDAAPMGDRTSGVVKNSFFAGHVALVASSTFFLAKVYSDYHPGSKIKWVFYTGASAATLATAYLRHRAGKHFPSDLIVGTVIGTATGILVPHFHKHRLIKNPNISIHPYTGRTTGVYAVYRFK